ncbi:MAG TPA: kelch repeat-containing protein [Candidatus Sulfotelmatobacter sp.]|jgi:N-acetylneuraminic acid mutarotase|nr:kelch repeat-containing protein [Candidatus Sulfotelmatobacter sp.]
MKNTRSLFYLLVATVLTFGFAFLLAPRARAQPNFTNTGSLANAREGHTATLLSNGLELVSGGENDIGWLASCELYNPATGTWTNTGSLNTGRYVHTATLLPNGLVLVSGGENNSGWLASCELYNPATGTWTNTGSLTTARAIHTATLLPNGMVLVSGGSTNGNVPLPLTSCELYNPATGTWTNTGSLVNARYAHTATLLPNSLVLASGGWGVGNGAVPLTSCELYNPATGTWTNTGSLTNARYAHTATLLPNGMDLVSGGYNGKVRLTSCELYNPATGIWTNTGSLNAARSNHTATRLPNGLVLVAGGYGNAPLTSCELYNPTNGTWTTAGSLNTARAVHTATLLPSGLVLVSGGYNYSSGYLASCELYCSGFGPGPAFQTLAVASILNAGEVNGLFTVNFTNIIGMPFSVQTTTNTVPPVAWSTLGVATEFFPGQFQFTDCQPPTTPGRFYRVTSP